MEESNQVRDAFIQELHAQAIYERAGVLHQKDILIVVHNQLDYIKKCVETIYANTYDFNLYIWDNASDEPTAEYLRKLTNIPNVIVERSEENLGFIKPNNRLAALSKSPYIILLNSDTEVHKGWDTALIGWLENKPNCAQVGYLGGLLDKNGQGVNSLSGNLLDYVCGWCFCITKDTYNKFGLFDEQNLEFAYAEDADYSLRLLEDGRTIHALHLGLVIHHGNATINEVQKKRDCKTTFEKNHEYLRHRWARYLRTRRILIKHPNLRHECPQPA